MGDVVGVRAQDDVLHPGADVGGEGAEEDDAEGAVPQGRDRRTRWQMGLSPSTTASSISSSVMSRRPSSPPGPGVTPAW